MGADASASPTPEEAGATTGSSRAPLHVGVLGVHDRAAHALGGVAVWGGCGAALGGAAAVWLPSASDEPFLLTVRFCWTLSASSASMPSGTGRRP